MTTPIRSSQPTPKPVRPAATKPAPAQAAPEAPKAVRAQAEAEPEKPSGFFGGVADWMLEKKRNIDKLGTFEKIAIALVGAFVGWKVNGWVNKQLEKSEGNNYDKNGQDRYLKLKDEGPRALVAALAEKPSLISDPLRREWRAFNTFAVLSEIQSPTLGTHEGEPNRPIALIALAGNPGADDTAIQTMASGIRTRINGTPALKEFYQPVIDALKTTHGVTV